MHSCNNRDRLDKVKKLASVVLKYTVNSLPFGNNFLLQSYAVSELRSPYFMHTFPETPRTTSNQPIRSLVDRIRRDIARQTTELP